MSSFVSSRQDAAFNPSNNPDFNWTVSIPSSGARTIAAAKAAFKDLEAPLSTLEKKDLLPEHFSAQPGEAKLESKEHQPLCEMHALSGAPEASNIHWLETISLDEERKRLRVPSLNAVLRLCYLVTLDGKTKKVPFEKEDLETFTLSKNIRNRTYFWFKAGIALFTGLSIIQGFASVLLPSKEPRDSGAIGQGFLITAAGTTIAALGVLFTGIYPDHSQDCANNKIDKLNRIKAKLEEVARTLVIFCFDDDYRIRKFAQIAASEISIENIESSAIASGEYAIAQSEIAPALELLRQAVDYINYKKIPEDHQLNMLIQELLKDKASQLAGKTRETA